MKKFLVHQVFIISIYFSLIINSCFSQNIIICVKEISTNRPVPFCSIVVGNWGTFCDSAGNLNLRPSQILSDSVVISSHGYFTKSLHKNDLIANKINTIFLNEKITELKEVEVYAKVNGSFSYGKLKKTSNFYDLISRINEVGRLFKNTLIETHVLKKFSFYTKIKGKVRPIIKINIYKVFDDKPIEINYQIILLSKQIKKGWNSIDLSNFNYSIPKEGVFISLEYSFEKMNTFEKGSELNNNEIFAIGISQLKKPEIAFSRVNIKPFKSFLGVYQGVNNSYYSPTFYIDVYKTTD